MPKFSISIHMQTNIRKIWKLCPVLCSSVLRYKLATDTWGMENMCCGESSAKNYCLAFVTLPAADIFSFGEGMNLKNIGINNNFDVFIVPRYTKKKINEWGIEKKIIKTISSHHLIMQMRLSYDWMTRFYLSFILFYETPAI